MDFRGFLGNEDLKSRLAGAFSRRMDSHSYLLCGPEGSGRKTLTAVLAAAMECTGTGQLPCGVCAACRKAFSGQHPDIITVDDTEHKGVPVELIRQMRADVFVRPNEGRRKIYILPRAQDMGPAAQNALLKILEEPPDYAAFFLLTTSAEKILPTVRSRCAELHLSPVPQAAALQFLRGKYPQAPEEALLAALEAGNGWLGQALLVLEEGSVGPEAAAFAAAFAARNDLELLRVLLPMEKYRREQLLTALQQMKALLCRVLEVRSGRPGDAAAKAVLKSRTGAEIFAAAQRLQAAAEHVNANVSTAAVIGWLTSVLR